MKRETGFRWLVYILGILVLTLGLTLNTKTGLGTSPIMSMCYAVSEIWGWNLGNATLGFYVLFVAMEFVLRGKKSRLSDLLQLPLSLVFTRVLNVYNDAIQLNLEAFWQKLLVLAVSILLTGLGVVLMLDMKLVPNPGDGIVQAIAERAGIELGLAKNLFDIGSVVCTFVLGLATGHVLLGIGLGTVAAMIGVGRSISLFNWLLKDKIQRLAGVAG